VHFSQVKKPSMSLLTLCISVTEGVAKCFVLKCSAVYPEAGLLSNFWLGKEKKRCHWVSDLQLDNPHG